MEGDPSTAASSPPSRKRSSMKAVTIGAVVVVAIVAIAAIVYVSLQDSPGDLPGPPTGLTAEAVGVSVSLQWNAPADKGAGIDGYRVYMSNASGSYSNASVVGGVSGNVTAWSFRDTSIANGTYYIVVRAFNGQGDGAFSNEVNASIINEAGGVPSAPSDLSVISEGALVTLTWLEPTDIGSGIVGYHIYMSNASDNFSSEPTMTIRGGSPGGSFGDAALVGGTYYFVVTAYNDQGESGHSNEASTFITGITGSLMSQLVDPGNYTITLVSLTNSDHLAMSKDSVSITVEPSGPTISDWQLPYDYLMPGDSFTVSGLLPGTTYTLSLVNDLNGATIASITIIA